MSISIFSGSIKYCIDTEIAPSFHMESTLPPPPLRWTISAFQVLVPVDLPLRALSLHRRVQTCAPVPPDHQHAHIFKPGNRSLQFTFKSGERQGEGPAVPEDCAVVGVGQLEVLGCGRRGEADHLNISHVIQCIWNIFWRWLSTVSGKMILEGNGLDDAWRLRRRIEIATQVRAELELDNKAMMECLASLLLLLATWIDCWAWMEGVEKTGLEFQEPVGIPARCLLALKP